MNCMQDRDNIKIEFGIPQFIINEKDKLVICKLEFRAKMPSSLKNILYNKNGETTPEWYRVVKSIAFTKDNDTFDEGVGKKVALAKAENQAYSYVRNCMTNALVEVIKITKAVKEFNDKTDRVINHNISYMRKF